VLSDNTLASWDTRIAGLKKRFANEKTETERYVNKYVESSMHFLDAKEKMVEKHQAVVDALVAEVATLREKESDSIVQMTATMREGIVTKMEAVKKAQIRNDEALTKLKQTVTKGDTLGEESRYARILEHWTLCDLKPNHPDCTEVVKKSLPGVHIVVESTNSAKAYPKSLAADEASQAKAGKHSGVATKAKHAVKSKQR
jgi:hypothetical protein